MIDSNLAQYINQARGQGQTDTQIKQSLISNGWQEALVNEALNPTATTSPAPAAATGRTISHRKATVNSPYSVMLAIVLTVSLFILANKIISDIVTAYKSDVTASLIMSGIVVVPFLILAFLLHFTLGEENEKFLILSRPYYLVSAWLLIRLLYDVSKYILDQNSAYGVYVVLILIIVVLTGMIVFVQKYLRKT